MKHQFLRGLAIVGLALTLGACSTVSGWFEMDDDEDPTQPVELEDIEETVDVDRIWSTGVGDGQGEGLYRIRPVIDGDTIYAASAEGEVVALDRSNGRKRWRVELETPLSGGVGVYENSVFLGGNDGSVIRLDARSGDLIWSAPVSGEVLAAPQGDGRVVVAQTYDGKLTGLDFADGSKLWTYDSNVPVLTLRGTSTPILRDGVVFAAFANGRVIAFQANTGAVGWEVRVAISQGRSEIERIVDIDGSMELLDNELSPQTIFMHPSRNPIFSPLATRLIKAFAPYDLP